MKKLHPLLSVLFLIYWGCEEEVEEDTTPPTVSIQSPITNQTVNGIVNIIVETNDNEGINRVEFYINDSLSFTDTESPYQYDWNTLHYKEYSETIIKVISYDNSGNFTESQSILLTVDNRVYLWGELYIIKNTTELSLSSNELTGEIPSKIGNLINLTSLDLDNNELTGSIPSEMGNLTNLSYLNLGQNGLTGSIPSEIGDLGNLLTLYLSNNQLSGEIPESICDLYQTTLFLSNNQLCPPYPSCVEDYLGQQDTTNCD